MTKAFILSSKYFKGLDQNPPPCLACLALITGVGMLRPTSIMSPWLDADPFTALWEPALPFYKIVSELSFFPTFYYEHFQNKVERSSY